MILYICFEKKSNVKDCLVDYALQKNLKLTKKHIQELEIVRGEHGKPYFKELKEKTKLTEAVKFSISHSGRFWACLMSNSEVGMDIEDLKYREKGLLKRNNERYEVVSKRFFTPKEHEFVVKNGLLGFIEIWIRKEAYIKYSGRGLAQGLDSFSVLNERGELIGSKEPLNQLIIQEIDVEKYFENGENLLDLKSLKCAVCENGLGDLEKIINI